MIQKLNAISLMRKTIKVDVGDYVRCNSSREYHSCERVMSRIPRIVISYGILLKQKNMSFYS